MEILRSYKYYDNQGRRVAIFAEKDGEDRNLFKLTVITCSRADKFSKKKANELYHTIQGQTSMVCKPRIYRIAFEPGHEKRDFLQWCKQYYKKPVINTRIEKKWVIVGDKNYTVKKEVSVRKLSQYI